MKKYIAIVCLLALLLAGCGNSTTDETRPQSTEPDTTATQQMAEQVVPPTESTLTGSWTATLNKGQYAAAIYYQSLELDEGNAAYMSGIFADAQYPLNVTLQLNEDGTYTFEVQADDGTGFDAFVESFGAIAAENDVELLSADLRQMLLDARLDKLFLMPRQEQGTWEDTDQGLVLSGWCTIQYHMDGTGLHWDNTDDAEFAEDLPLSFKAN